MPKFRTAYIFVISILIAVLSGLPAIAQNARDFWFPEGIVTDFTSTLSNDDLNEIRDSLDVAYQSNMMDGHVIIVSNTKEWYLNEYVKDYADYLQGHEFIKSTGWLLYISIEDRKFALAVQDVAAKSITLQHKQEIALVLSEKFELGDTAGAILDAVSAIAKLPAPKSAHKEKNFSSDMLIFMGIAIMVITLVLRLRILRKKGYTQAK